MILEAFAYGISEYQKDLSDAAMFSLCLFCTVNFLNIRTPKKFVVITLNFELWLYHRVMSPNDVDGMANSVDYDQTAPLGWSGSALFAQAYLSENLGSLRY